MRTIFRNLPLIAGLAIMAVSCSLKEDRTPCPCWLDIFLAEESDTPLMVSLWQGSEQLFNEELDKDDFRPCVEKEVRRGYHTMSAYLCKDSMITNGQSFTIPNGQQCDSLYTHLNQVNCNGESAVDTVKFHKQFATLYLQIMNAEQVDYPYTLTVCGNICGMDLTSLKPKEGPFRYSPSFSEEYVGTCRLPRQKDNSLVLEFTKSENGELVDSIQLGEMIAGAGFDWNAKDLNDIVITIDFAKADIIVTVNEWQSDFTYEIEI